MHVLYKCSSATRSPTSGGPKWSPMGHPNGAALLAEQQWCRAADGEQRAEQQGAVGQGWGARAAPAPLQCCCSICTSRAAKLRLHRSVLLAVLQGLHAVGAVMLLALLQGLQLGGCNMRAALLSALPCSLHCCRVCISWALLCSLHCCRVCSSQAATRGLHCSMHFGAPYSAAGFAPCRPCNVPAPLQGLHLAGIAMLPAPCRVCTLQALQRSCIAAGFAPCRHCNAPCTAAGFTPCRPCNAPCTLQVLHLAGIAMLLALLQVLHLAGLATLPAPCRLCTHRLQLGAQLLPHPAAQPHALRTPRLPAAPQDLHPALRTAGRIPAAPPHGARLLPAPPGSSRPRSPAAPRPSPGSFLPSRFRPGFGTKEPFFVHAGQGASAGPGGGVGFGSALSRFGIAGSAAARRFRPASETGGGESCGTAEIPMERRSEKGGPRAARGALCLLQIPEPDPFRLCV